jgi:hypothetical protein
MSPRCHLSEDQVHRIARQIKDGKCRKLVCLNYKVSPLTLRMSLRRHGYDDIAVDPNPFHKRLTPELVQTALELIKAGATQAVAAMAIGFSVSSLNKTIKGRERYPRNAPRKQKERPVEFFSDLKLKDHVDFNNQHLSTLQLRANL